MKTTRTKTYIGGKLHDGQLNIVKDILTSNYFYHTIRCSRQFGKSFLGLQLVLYYAINNNDYNVLYTAPTYSQVNKVFKEFKKAVIHTDLVDKFNGSENSVILKNGSEIYFKSIQQPDNLRGYSIDVMVCDEAALYKEGIFDEVLKPMLAVKGKKCFLLSTPKGKNWFYKMDMLSKSNKRYKSYKETWRTNPLANLEEIADAKKVLPPLIYTQEYEAEFIDDGGEVFSNVRRQALTVFKEPSNETYYAGIDFGRQNDYTVLTILNKDNEVVFIYRDNQKQWSTIIDNLAKYLKKYNVANCLVEVNGIGDVLFEQLKTKFKNIEPFISTNDTKQEIIEHLILAFQNENIFIPQEVIFEHLIDELNDFTFIYSKSQRKIIYRARTGHDDCVISLALSHKCKIDGKAKGKYSLI